MKTDIRPLYQLKKDVLPRTVHLIHIHIMFCRYPKCKYFGPAICSYWILYTSLHFLFLTHTPIDPYSHTSVFDAPWNSNLYQRSYHSSFIINTVNSLIFLNHSRISPKDPDLLWGYISPSALLSRCCLLFSIPCKQESCTKLLLLLPKADVLLLPKADHFLPLCVSLLLVHLLSPFCSPHVLEISLSSFTP